MKDSSWVMLVLLLGIISTTIQNFVTMQEVVSLEEKMKIAQKEYEGHIEDIYFLMKSDGSKLYTIMDTEVRILHYAKPHKHTMVGCPECAEQKQRGEKDDVHGRDKHEEGEKETD
jgi:hypothetical protein|tara:strand:- start:277 stop:621 length:345 start_codon:yes stop_codon:yes gene_type:complete